MTAVLCRGRLGRIRCRLCGIRRRGLTPRRCWRRWRRMTLLRRRGVPGKGAVRQRDDSGDRGEQEEHRGGQADEARAHVAGTRRGHGFLELKFVSDCSDVAYATLALTI